MQDVADHRARGAGDHPHHLGHGRQGTLAGRVEQALGLEPGLEFLELGQKGADARRLHALDDDLVARAHRVGGHLAGDDHLQPLLGPHAEAPHAALPDHAVDAGLVVLDRQIDVAVGVEGDLGQLAPQPHEAVGVFQRPLQRERQLRDAIGLGVAGLGRRAVDVWIVVEAHGPNIGVRGESRILARSRVAWFETWPCGRSSP